MAAILSQAFPSPGFSPTLLNTSSYGRTVNISATNQNGYPVAITVTISYFSAGSIEYNTIIPGYGTYERGGVVIPSGSATVAVSSTAGNVPFTAYGYDTQ